MTLLHDGPLGDAIGPEVLQEIAGLEPYGRGFETPVFCDTFTLVRVKPVGDGTHLRLELVDAAGQPWAAIWFRAIEAGADPNLTCGPLSVIYTLEPPGPRSRQSVELYVKSASPV